jgi:iron complex transport system permease protein
LGALLTIGVVFYFGKQDGKIHPNTLLLAGVIIGSFLSALIMFFISVSQKEELHTIIFWLMGDFSFSSPQAIRMIFPYIVFGIILLYYQARQLNLVLSVSRFMSSAIFLYSPIMRSMKKNCATI